MSIQVRPLRFLVYDSGTYVEFTEPGEARSDNNIRRGENAHDPYGIYICPG